MRRREKRVSLSEVQVHGQERAARALQNRRRLVLLIALAIVYLTVHESSGMAERHELIGGVLLRRRCQRHLLKHLTLNERINHARWVESATSAMLAGRVSGVVAAALHSGRSISAPSRDQHVFVTWRSGGN